MNEYVDVDIIENGKVIGTTKILKKTEEPEEQNIKLNKVDDKTAYQNLLIKCAELEADNRLLEQRGSDILKELLDKNKKCIELERQIEKMKRHCNCKHRDSEGYCEVKRTYLIDLSYDGCDKWELED